MISPDPEPNGHDFAQYRGQLWVATVSGLAVYDTDEPTSSPPPRELEPYGR